MSKQYNRYYRVALSEDDLLDGNILGEHANAFEALMQAKAKGIPDYKLFEFTTNFREITQEEVKQNLTDYFVQNIRKP